MDRKLVEEFKGFCKRLDKKDRVAVLHHSDPDGFCSALVAMKAVEKLTGSKPVVTEHYEYANGKQAKEFLKAVKKKKANKLILVDIAIDGDGNWSKVIEPFEECLIIDHHKVYKNLSSKKIAFIKAGKISKKDPAQYACSKLCYDLFIKVADVSGLDWATCIGIMGDMTFRSWKPFVKKVIAKRKLDLKKLCKLLDTIAATEVMAPKRMKTLLNEFYSAKKPKDLLKSKFGKYIASVKKERDLLIYGFGKKAEYFIDLELFIYEISVKREGIKSYVVNEISQLNPDKTVIVIQDAHNGWLRISARRQDYKVKMNDLMEKSVKGIPKSNAGGHIPAAAAKIPRTFREKFRKNMLNAAKKMMKK